MKSRSLLAQVLAVNLLLVGGTMLVATIVADTRLAAVPRTREGVVLVLAILATLLGNWLLLYRRFHPLDALISAMEKTDLAAPVARHTPIVGTQSAEVRRLQAAFHRMVSRLESERRRAGRAAIEAQERERRRIAQDLHDEVNQALTAVSLRLQASIAQAPPGLREELTETKRLAGRAMEELLAIARQLRPTVLDDRGLIPALDTQVRHFSEQTGIKATFTVTGTAPHLSAEQQLTLYRVTQEGLSNIAQHARARTVKVELSFVGTTMLAITDDGEGFEASRAGGLGLSGMRERALLVGAQLHVRSSRGRGTRVEVVLR